MQAGASGGREVATAWPGLLTVTVPPGQPRLKNGGWYLVEGRLDVPPGNDLPAARLQAHAVFACTRPQCADATDPAAVVDRKLAAIGSP